MFKKRRHSVLWLNNSAPIVMYTYQLHIQLALMETTPGRICSFSATLWWYSRLSSKHLCAHVYFHPIFTDTSLAWHQGFFFPVSSKDKCWQRLKGQNGEQNLIIAVWFSCFLPSKIFFFSCSSYYLLYDYRDISDTELCLLWLSNELVLTWSSAVKGHFFSLYFKLRNWYKW